MTSKWVMVPPPAPPEEQDTIAPTVVAPPEPITSGKWQHIPVDSAQPQAQTPAVAEPESHILGDMGASFGMGAAGLVGGAGWILDTAGFDGTADGLYAYAERSLDYYTDKLSEEGKAGLQKEFFRYDKERGGAWYKPWTWEDGDAGWREALMQGMQSLPGTAVGMGAGAGLARGLYAITKTFGSAGGIKALEAASKLGRSPGAAPEVVAAGARAEKFLKYIGTAAGGVGGAIGEATVASSMTGQQIKTQVNIAYDQKGHDWFHENVPEYKELYDNSRGEIAEAELPEDQYRELILDNLADKAAFEGASKVFGTTALFGGLAGAYVWGPLANKAAFISKPFATGKVAGLAKGALGEAMEEMPQSGFEAYFTDAAMRDYTDPEIDAGRNVFSAVVAGAVGGALMGGPFGFAGAESKGAGADRSIAMDAEANDRANAVLAGYGGNAGAALTSKFGKTREEAMALLDPIVQRYADTQDLRTAISDLRYLEINGVLRERGEGGTGEPPALTPETLNLRQEEHDRIDAGRATVEAATPTEAGAPATGPGETKLSAAGAAVGASVPPDEGKPPPPAGTAPVQKEEAAPLAPAAAPQQRELVDRIRELRREYVEQNTKAWGKPTDIEAVRDKKLAGKETEDQRFQRAFEETERAEAAGTLTTPEQEAAMARIKEINQELDELYPQLDEPTRASLVAGEPTPVAPAPQPKAIGGIPAGERGTVFNIKGEPVDVEVLERSPQTGATRVRLPDGNEAVVDGGSERGPVGAVFSESASSPDYKIKSGAARGKTAIDLTDAELEQATAAAKESVKAGAGQLKNLAVQDHIRDLNALKAEAKIRKNKPAPVPEPVVPAPVAENGFITSPSGQRIRIGAHSRGSQLLDPNEDVGALTYEIRSAEAYDPNPLTMVLNKEGKLVQTGSVLNKDNSSNGTAWIPPTQEIAEQAKALLQARAETAHNSPERKSIDAQIKALVVGTPAETGTGAVDKSKSKLTVETGETTAPAEDVSRGASDETDTIPAEPTKAPEETKDRETARRNSPDYTEGLQGAIGADGRLRLSHFSTGTLTRTDPELAGTGYDRAKQGRRYLPNVTYFGITLANENPYARESGVGSVEHVTSIEPTALYPASKDPEKLWVYDDGLGTSTAEERYKQSIANMREAGFSGFWADDESLGKVAVIWEAMPVQLAGQAVSFSLGPKEGAWPQSRRDDASRRMREWNKTRALVMRNVKALFQRFDWTAIEKGTDASAAGAMSEDEAQEAAIEWVLFGTSSKYFKRWFKDSPLTDRWKTPIKFYHATTVTDIKEWHPFKRGFISVSTNPNFGEQFLASKFAGANKGVVYPLYCNAQKIFDFRNTKMRRSLIRAIQKLPDGVALKKWDAMLSKTGSLSGDLRAGNWRILEDESVQKILKDRGYEAFWMGEEGNMNLGVFSGHSLKSAVGNVGTFRPSSPEHPYQFVYALKAPLSGDVWYSSVERWMDSKMPNSMPVAQLFAAFSSDKALGTKGVKREEVLDMGLLDWLQKFPEKEITKEQALAFVKANKTVLHEIENRGRAHSGGGRRALTSQTARDEVDEVHATFLEQAKYWMGLKGLWAGTDPATAMPETMRGLKIEAMSAEQMQQAEDDYRLLGFDAMEGHVPKEVIAEFKAKLDIANLDVWQADYMEDSQLNSGDDQLRTDTLKYQDYTLGERATPMYREFLMKVPLPSGEAGFESTHWTDRHVVVHLRFTGRFDPATGVSTLMVEEVQSDWHQQGYRYGYNTPDTPDAPLKQSWKMVGMKRLIRYAAENGFTEVAWTTGDIQQNRYDISKTIQDITITKSADTTSAAAGEQTYSMMVIPHGNARPGMAHGLTRKDLGRHVSEELADRLVEKMGDGDSASLVGPEVRWTAAAVKAFYDGSLKKATNLYIKKWGVQAELKDFFNPVTNAYDKMWAFPVTEEMREDVLQGQSTYSLADSVSTELARRIELYQMKAYLERTTNPSTKPKVIKARVIEGIRRGFYSHQIAQHAGVLLKPMTRDQALIRIAETVRGKDITHRTSLPVYIIEQEIRRIMARWTNAPQFVVHEDWTTLPDYIRQNVEINRLQNRVEGTIDPLDRGKVHIVANNIGTMENLHRVFTEESLGHYGLRSFFKVFEPGGEAKLDEFLKGVLPSVRGSEGWDALLNSYTNLRDLIERGPPEVAAMASLRAVEELIAKQDVDQGVWDKFVAWFRDMLRWAGLITNYTENDIKRIMTMVHDNVMSGRMPHAWGARNMQPSAYSGGLVYSLLGGLMSSRLEAALSYSKFPHKAPPKVYLDKFFGPEEASDWTASSAASQRAAGGLQLNDAGVKGVTENEMRSTGIHAFLLNAYRTAPKTAITSAQLMEVYRNTKLTVLAISRAGHYLFPLPTPISSLLQIKMREDLQFDRDAASKEAGYFSRYITDTMDNQDRLLKFMKAQEVDEDIEGAITPRVLFGKIYGVSPFGINNIPRLQEFESQGFTSAEIGLAIGMEDIDAPVSSTNSNPAMRGWVTEMTIQLMEQEGSAFVTVTQQRDVGFAGFSGNQTIRTLPISFTADGNGVVNEVIILGGVWQHKRGDEFAAGSDAEEEDEAQWLLDEDAARTYLNEQLTTLHQPGRLADGPATKAFIQEKFDAYLRQYAASLVDSATPESIAAARGLARSVHLAYKSMGGAVSFSGRAEMGAGVPNAAKASESTSYYDEYTLTGGEKLDVISFQLFGTDAISQTKEGRPGVYHYDKKQRRDFVHIRGKIRFIDDPYNPGQKLRVFAIEEIQSDWATSYNTARPLMGPELTEFANSNVKLIRGLTRLIQLSTLKLNGDWAHFSTDDSDETIARFLIKNSNNFYTMFTDVAFSRQARVLLQRTLKAHGTEAPPADRSAPEPMTMLTYNSGEMDFGGLTTENLNAVMDKLAAEAAAVPKDYNMFPWQRNYGDFALKAMTAWAVQAGFDGLIWPEGEQVANVYGTQLGTPVDGLVVNLQTMELFGGVSSSTVLADRGDAPTTRVQAISLINNSQPGKYERMSPAYLTEVIKEKHGDSSAAADMEMVVDTFLREGYAAAQELAKTTDQVTVVTKDGVQFVVLRYKTKHHLYARLHRLLYNSMSIQTAKDIARDSKEAVASGQAAVRDVFVPDAILKGNMDEVRRARDARRQEARRAGRGRRYGAGDRYVGPMSDAGESDADIKETRRIQLFGRDGDKLRYAATRQFWRQFPQDQAEYEDMEGDLTDNPLNGYFSGTAESASYTVFSGRQPGGDGGEAVRGRGILLQPQKIGYYMSKDRDDREPFDGLLDFSTPDGKTISMPIRKPYVNGGGEYVEGDGWGSSFSTGNSTTENNTTVTAMMWRFGYQVMKHVWKIENPNPFMLSGHIWRSVYKAMYRARDDFSRVGADGREGIVHGYVGRDPLGPLSNQILGEIVAQPPGLDENPSEPEDYRYPQAPIPPEDSLAHEVEFGIDPVGPFAAWARQTAVIKNQLDAALVLSVLMPNEDAELIAEVRALMEGLPKHRGMNDAGDMALQDIVPNGFLPEATRQPDAAYPEAAEELFEVVPQYDINNPQFPEQVWHALLFNDKIREQEIFAPFSLAPPGNDRELSIINKNIAKSSSNLTVLDRVTHWISVMNDLRNSGDILWSIRQGTLDSSASVEKWERRIFGDRLDASLSPHKMMHMTKNLPSVMAAIAKAGIPAMSNGAFQPVPGRKGFVEIFRPLYEDPRGNLLELWQGYAAARRASTLIGQVNPDGTGREKLFTPQEIQDLMALGTKYPVFQTVFNEWTAFNNNLLDLAVSQGVLTQAEKDLWAQYDYVPFYRALDEIEGVDQRTSAGPTKAGVSGQHHGIKRLWGSEKRLGNIVENMWFNTASLIDKIYKNEAMSRVVDMLEGVVMKQVNLPWEAIQISNAQLASALQAAGILSTNALAQIKQMTPAQRLQWSTIFRRVKPTGPNIVSVMRNGKLTYYEVDDPDLLRTLNGMSAEGVGALMKAMGLSKSLLTRMITIDPGFMLANWMRDTLSSWVTSSANFVPVLGSIEAAGDIWGEKGNYIKMMMAGAGGGGFYDLSGGNVTKALDIEMGEANLAVKIWRGYMKLGAVSENSNRLSIANRVLAKGGTAAEAMHQAQDILNFTMSGDYAAVRFLVRTVPFINARAQGVFKLARGAKEHPVGFLVKGSAIMLATLALLAKNWDDPDYEQLEDYQKDLDWSFFGKGMRYTLPKPFEIGLFFGTIPERLVRAMLGRDDLPVTADVLARAFGSTLAFNPIPQLFKPMYELGANINLFTGSPIVNQSLSGLEPKYQAHPWTSEAAVTIGEAMPDWSGPLQSPVRIEHAIRAYTGTVGMYTLSLADAAVRAFDPDAPPDAAKHWYEHPVVSRVVKGEVKTSSRNKYTEKFYEMLEASNKANQTLNFLEGRADAGGGEAAMNEYMELEGKRIPEIDMRDQLLDIQKQLKELSTMQRGVLLNKEMDPKAKREAIDQLNIERNAVLNSTADIIKQWDELKKTGLQ